MPQPENAGLAYHVYVDRLGQHLVEHERGEWVDPHVVAGDVANVHDLALRIVRWHELFA